MCGAAADHRAAVVLLIAGRTPCVAQRPLIDEMAVVIALIVAAVGTLVAGLIDEDPVLGDGNRIAAHGEGFAEGHPAGGKRTPANRS